VKAYARMCGVSGLVFSALLVVALVLVKQAPTLASTDADYQKFYAGGHSDDLVTLGLYIVPFAGIAFLWHMATVRTLLRHVRSQGDEIPRFLQQASGVLFVAMLFAGSALVGAVALLSVFSHNPPPAPDIARGLTSSGYGLVFVYGVRGAGMYLLTTTTLARKGGLMATPVAIVSYVAGAFLLVSTTFHPAILLVFPAWTALIAVLALIRARRPEVTS